MDPLESLGKPLPAIRRESWSGCIEVGSVTVSMCVPGLEQQHDLRPAVRDPVLRPIDDPVIRQPKRLVAAANPRVAVGRLAEDVESPEVRLRFAHPGLVCLG